MGDGAGKLKAQEDQGGKPCQRAFSPPLSTMLLLRGGRLASSPGEGYRRGSYEVRGVSWGARG